MTFHPFRIDLRERRLWRGANAIDLKPKAFAVLAHLAARAGRLVTFEELGVEVWRGTFVSAATLRSTVREVRRALGDRPRSPRFIDTVHGRGYRFIAPTVGSRDGAETSHEAGTAPTLERLAGRSQELERLYDEFAIASSGKRRLVLLAGEPGVGKTALAEEFLRVLQTQGEAVCAFGSCISGHGSIEPYLPILEALERLCRGPWGRRQQDLLESFAPMWMLELPGLVDPKTTRRLRADAIRLDRDRMLLELAHAIEALCTEEPLVLLLEDLHWSDPASLGAIELLARRTERARLLVIGTHRPLPAHSSLDGTERLRTLRAELEPRGLCTTLEVAPLSFAATQAYVAHRFPALEDSAQTVSQFLYSRSEGNPLLFVACADALVQQGLLERTDDGWQIRRDIRELEIPKGLRRMLDYQLDHYSADDRELLERASVMGSDFDPYALQKSSSPEPDLDDRLFRIARGGGVIRPRGDGFTFVHELYREMLYEGISPKRQGPLHQSIGERIEHEHAAQTADVASSLAVHFERSGDTGRAVRYLRETAALATQRSAHDEAETLLRRAWARIGNLPRGRERDRTEFGVAAQLGNALTLTRGYVAAEVRDVYDRAVALSEAIDDEAPELMTALAGLHAYYELRGEHAASTKIALRQLHVADRTGAAFDRVVASLCRGTSCFSVGNYDEAARQLTICIEAYDREKHGPANMQVATDHGANCLGYGSLVFGALGRLDQARDWIARSLALARDLAHVPSIALSLYYAMIVEQLLRHVDRADRFATECLELSTKHAFPYFVPATLVVSGWVMAQRGDADAGADQASRGLTILKDAGARLGQPLWTALVAEACCASGRFDEGLAAVEEGLVFVRDTGEVAAEPALHWMRGKLLWEQSGASEAEACLVRGVETARLRGAHTQALGPATLLARIRAAAGRRDEAASGLAAALQPMTPAADVPLLIEAEAVLREL